MTKEYIEREAAIEAIMSDPPDAHYPSWYIDRIKTLSAADVAPVVHGRWVFGKDLPDSFGSINKNKYHLCFLCADEPPCDGCNWKKYLIVCNTNIGGCGAASGLYDTKEEAIEAWNRRCGDDSN